MFNKGEKTMAKRVIRVGDTGRGRDIKNPLCSLDDYEAEYRATLISMIGKLSEWNQKRQDNGRDYWTAMTSLDLGDQLELGRGHTRHNDRERSTGKKRNSIASVIMGQLYNYENNLAKYPTGASVSWNQLQDFSIITKQFAGEFPDEYDEIDFVLNVFDWNRK